MPVGCHQQAHPLLAHGLGNEVERIRKDQCPWRSSPYEVTSSSTVTISPTTERKIETEWKGKKKERKKEKKNVVCFKRLESTTTSNVRRGLANQPISAPGLSIPYHPPPPNSLRHWCEGGEALLLDLGFLPLLHLLFTLSPSPSLSPCPPLPLSSTVLDRPLLSSTVLDRPRPSSFASLPSSSSLHPSNSNSTTSCPSL